MDESRIDIPQTPKVTEIAEKAEDELTQSISSIPEELVNNIPEELVNNMMGDIKIQEWLLAERKDNDEEIGRTIALKGLAALTLLRSFDQWTGNLPRSNGVFRSMDWQSLGPSAKGVTIKNDEQIPFIVLKKILEWERDANKDENRQADTDQRRADTDQDLVSILKRAWLKLSPFQYDSPDSHVIAGVPLQDDSHVLEFLYENIIGSSDSPSDASATRRKNERRVRDITLPRAVQLKGKEVKFARNEGLLKNIRFEPRNLTLYLPAIEMDSGTKAVFRNLVLFEASQKGKESQPLMSYVNLMGRLIDTAEDVQCLQEVGIIHSHLGTNDDVAKVWNEMREQLPTNNIKYEPIDIAIYDVKSFYISF